MRRRDFTLLLGCLVVWPLRAAEKTARIAFLGNSTAALEANLVRAFREGLRDLGYVEGDTILIEYRWAEGDYSRFPALIAELVALQPSVIVTAGTPAALAVAKATDVIPCVMVAVGDPVGTGLIHSLAKPGGNLTGLTSIAPELEGKRLALLREVVPKLAQLAVFWNPDNPFHVISVKQVQTAADLLTIKVHFVEVRTSEDIEGALASIEQERVEGLVVPRTASSSTIVYA